MPPELRLVLGIFPPWVAACLLLGCALGALFFILAGKRLLSLPLYLVLGALAAMLGQIASLALRLEPWPVPFGQLHVGVVTASVMAVLFVVRLHRL